MTIKRTGNGKIAVVGWGRGMGHKGHMYLASSVITQSKDMKADPYFFISTTVGKDDPLFPEEKVRIYQKVFPQQAPIFQPQSNLNQALTELANMGYQGVVVVVGSDQKQAFQYLERPNKEGVPVYKSFGLQKLRVISRQETRDSSKELEGPRATPMREVLLNPDATEDQKFEVWRDAMPDALGDDDVVDFMHKAEARLMGSRAKKQKIKEYIERIRPLLETATVEQKVRAFRLLKEAVNNPLDDDDAFGYLKYFKKPEKKPVDTSKEKRFHGWDEYEKEANPQLTKKPDEVEEGRILNPNSQVLVYFRPDTNKAGTCVTNRPISLDMAERLIATYVERHKGEGYRPVYPEDFEVRPINANQYRRSTEPELAETALQGQEDLDAKRKALQDMEREPGHDKEAIRQRKLDLDKEARSKGLAEETVNEFAIDKPGDGDGRSKLIGSIVRLLQAGNKVDFFVPGIRGHVVGTGSNGQSLTLKRWKKPYSKVNYSLDLDSSDDNRFVLKMINPDYYQVVEKNDLDEGIFGGLGGPASGPMLARGGPGYAGLSGAKKLRHDAYVELQMVDSLKHTNHNGRYDAEIKKKLLQAQEYLAKAKEIEQGLAEASFDKEAFRQQMKDLEAREELRKTDPVSAKALDLRGKLPKTVKKKPEDDSININDPRHPGYAYTQAGQHKLDEFAPDDGNESRKFIPWNEFVDQLKQILHKDFDCKESINMDVIKAKFVPYDPMEYGPTMIYSYFERRAGRKGANGVRGQIQVGNFFKGSKPGDNQLMTGFHLLKGTEFERYFDLTFDNLYKIARIIQGNTQGRLESQQGVAEGNRPGTTPGFNDTLDADEKRRQQRSQERKAQDKSTMSGINKNRAAADAYRKSGVAEAEGISRRGILKGIAGAGALGAAGKASGIAGAFPTPSQQQAMYKAAADSNAAQARADAAEKAKRDAQRLKQGTADIERLNKINFHGGKVTPINATWDGDSDFMDVDGTQYSMASRMPIKGDEPGNMKLVSTKEGRLVYMWTRNSLKGVVGRYFYPAPEGTSQINEFAPGNGDDDGEDYDLEFQVYQCNPENEFEFIGGPLQQFNDLGRAHDFAYKLHMKNPDKAFMIFQPSVEHSRGGYGITADDESDEMNEDYLPEK